MKRGATRSCELTLLFPCPCFQPHRSAADSITLESPGTCYFLAGLSQPSAASRNGIITLPCCPQHTNVIPEQTPSRLQNDLEDYKQPPPHQDRFALLAPPPPPTAFCMEQLRERGRWEMLLSKGATQVYSKICFKKGEKPVGYESSFLHKCFPDCGLSPCTAFQALLCGSVLQRLSSGCAYSFECCSPCSCSVTHLPGSSCSLLSQTRRGTSAVAVPWEWGQLPQWDLVSYLVCKLGLCLMIELSC